MCDITLNMSRARNIRFRLDEDKIDALDAIAYNSNRDRSSLLNEAVANYLDLHAYHSGLIKKGLMAVKQGRTIGTAEVRARIVSLERGRRTNPKK
jgi:predicted transcriptional regulator